MTTLDVITSYRLPFFGTREGLEASLGMLNLTNAHGGRSEVLFDPRLDGAQPSFLEVNYFPGNARALIGGLAWNF